MMVVVNRARPADREALVSLLGAQYDEHAIVIAPERLAAAVDGVLEDPSRGQILVARDAGTGAPVGIAYLALTWSLEHGGRSAWLEELFVEPEHRRRGIGRRLLLAACKTAVACGCAAVDLEVEQSHARVESLYLREGFRRHTRRRWVRVLDRAERKRGNR